MISGGNSNATHPAGSASGRQCNVFPSGGWPRKEWNRFGIPVLTPGSGSPHLPAPHGLPNDEAGPPVTDRGPYFLDSADQLDVLDGHIDPEPEFRIRHRVLTVKE